MTGELSNMVVISDPEELFHWNDRDKNLTEEGSINGRGKLETMSIDNSLKEFSCKDGDKLAEYGTKNVPGRRNRFFRSAKA